VETPQGAEHHVTSEPECLDIVVLKTGLMLGFSIEGGRDSLVGDRPISVKRVFTGKQSLRHHHGNRQL